ncbi:MAG: hypothetical protein ISS56_02610 [Anaerolineae bacterium]|nr:hypothetical protein [Anaerolineae bacterium]
MKAKVSCAEGPWGCSTCVIIDPATQRVTHLAVMAKGAPYIERLVPIEMVVEATPGSIRLCCTRNELTGMELFVEATCVEVNPYAYHLLLGQHLDDECLLYPRYVQFQHKRVPTGAVALCQSARAKVVNKIVGRVDRFVVDSVDGHITHLVLRKGPPWRRKNVTVPVAQIESIGENTVHLKLDRISVEAIRHKEIPSHCKKC